MSSKFSYLFNTSVDMAVKPRAKHRIHESALFCIPQAFIEENCSLP